MKHPKLEVLQDYFENALNMVQEELVKEHLLNCDQCTRMLADLAVIEKVVKQQPALQPSAASRARTMSEAKALLALRKKQQQEKQAAITVRKEQKARLLSHLQEWKETLYPQIRIPAFQLASVAVLVMVVVAAERSSVEAEVFEPLSDEVQVYTFNDSPMKGEE